MDNLVLLDIDGEGRGGNVVAAVVGTDKRRAGGDDGGSRVGGHGLMVGRRVGRGRREVAFVGGEGSRRVFLMHQFTVENECACAEWAVEAERRVESVECLGKRMCEEVLWKERIKE